jgi:phospholipid/cholesterol/gamma-HCH transport system substrate-binding protein
MEYHRHEIRAGAILVGALLILLAMLYFSSDLAFWFRSTKEVFVTFKNVSGLVKSDPVLFKGVKVGKVSYMSVLTVQGGLAQVTLNIDANLPLYASVPGKPPGTQFKIAPQGLLGESAIEIIPGNPHNPELEPGSVVEGKEVVRIEELTNLVQEIATNVRDSMAVLTQTVNDPAVQAKFKNILDSLSDASTSLDKVITGNVRNINDIAANLATVTKDLNETSANLRALSVELNQIVVRNRDQINTLVENYKNLPTSVQGDVTKTQESITSLIEENRKQINEAIQHLDATSKHIEDLAEDLKKNPWKVIRKP